MGKRASTGGGVAFPVKYRKYAYGVMVAIAPVAVAYGIVTDAEAGLWVSLIGATLGLTNGLALVNTPTKD